VLKLIGAWDLKNMVTKTKTTKTAKTPKAPKAVSAKKAAAKKIMPASSAGKLQKTAPLKSGAVFVWHIFCF